MAKTIQTHDEYIATLVGFGRAWMLHALHSIGLKQGSRKFTDAQLAELLWNHTHAMKAVR